MESGNRTELLARIAALRSLLVIRRFAWKVGFFSCVAAGHAAAGHGFLRHLTALALASTILALVLGHWHRDRVDAPSYTYFDEAAWFLLLAFVTARLQ